ncbi:hypothetical protein C8R46DRAFT_1049540 [Mycena filopes]|nr:hypothetical protein C8R46DRAFT_1049540 [Mycena filopes]
MALGPEPRYADADHPPPGQLKQLKACQTAEHTHSFSLRLVFLSIFLWKNCPQKYNLPISSTLWAFPGQNGAPQKKIIHTGLRVGFVPNRVGIPRQLKNGSARFQHGSVQNRTGNCCICCVDFALKPRIQEVPLQQLGQVRTTRHRADARLVQTVKFEHTPTFVLSSTIGSSQVIQKTRRFALWLSPELNRCLRLPHIRSACSRWFKKLVEGQIQCCMYEQLERREPIGCALIGPQRDIHPETDGGKVLEIPPPWRSPTAPPAINWRRLHVRCIKSSLLLRPPRRLDDIHNAASQTAFLGQSFAALAPLPPDSPPTPTATPTALRTSSTAAPTSPRAEDVSIWLRWALSVFARIRGCSRVYFARMHAFEGGTIGVGIGARVRAFGGVRFEAYGLRTVRSSSRVRAGVGFGFRRWRRPFAPFRRHLGRALFSCIVLFHRRVVLAPAPESQECKAKRAGFSHAERGLRQRSMRWTAALRVSGFGTASAVTGTTIKDATDPMQGSAKMEVELLAPVRLGISHDPLILRFFLSSADFTGSGSGWRLRVNRGSQRLDSGGTAPVNNEGGFYWERLGRSLHGGVVCLPGLWWLRAVKKVQRLDSGGIAPVNSKHGGKVVHTGYPFDSGSSRDTGLGFFGMTDGVSEWGSEIEWNGRALGVVET